ncbi:MAG TPA: hypothetical protein DDX89_02830 [Candidatus Omnitrophica bacterium]|nr:MAG: hypothetical protein A2Z92_01390 [Omnitrophica WOR_2 bacterium GWA2_63_20]OGX19004.1 MAG: hypothetical protein A2105_03860 [Omnitrophica WOR_2 bacterium GWF2_63_9]OGX30798.1 MAG: hypothetical protein A3E56_02950 [Omnitrophica WOR_2 bacterium RIFCSPHIGHO2_12_FULL_64_13]OGX36068.1 MAG: hypothetical protein A3B73_04190 [Omnitrophica WOR_2 bacterium RIFCSPHIGHO2_02_FULL_63_39]OGX44116.1 MAG: hypothetical protein A3I71_05600 [Omnitrophica WOR_2 bacterium RIFCSPLOWO2_02_FULL_63_16]HAM42216.1
MSSLRRLADRDRWLRLAQRYLRFGTRSSAELRTYLTGRHASESAVARILKACIQAGLIDDRAGAKLLAQALGDRGYAAAAIRATLRDRGFHDHAIDDALNAMQARASDEQRARTVVAQALRRSSASTPRCRTAVASRLARRGFDPELIDHLLLEAFGPRRPDDE